MGTDNLQNAVELFVGRVRSSGSQTAMRFRQGSSWRSITFAEWDRRSREIAAGLCALGLRRGDRVALLVATRPEWMMCDVAIAMAGGVSVPLYPSCTRDQAGYIIRDAEAAFIFVDVVDGDEQLGKIPQVAHVR